MDPGFDQKKISEDTFLRAYRKKQAATSRFMEDVNRLDPDITDRLDPDITDRLDPDITDRLDPDITDRLDQMNLKNH